MAGSALAGSAATGGTAGAAGLLVVALGLPAALFFAFVALGVLYYCFVDKTFTFIDACYFIVVTMSTVGYGDFIGETSSRWFTAVVVQLIGSTMIFTLIGGCVDDLLQALESAFWRCVCVCRRWVVRQRLVRVQRAGHAHDRLPALSALRPLACACARPVRVRARVLQTRSPPHAAT